MPPWAPPRQPISIQPLPNALLPKPPCPPSELPVALTRSQAPAPARTGSAPSCSVGTTWWLQRELTGPGVRDPGPAKHRQLLPGAAGSGGLHPTTRRLDQPPRDHLERPPVPASSCCFRSQDRAPGQPSRNPPLPGATLGPAGGMCPGRGRGRQAGPRGDRGGGAERAGLAEQRD